MSLLLVPAAFVVIQDANRPPEPPRAALGNMRERRARGMDPRDQDGMSQGPGKGWRPRQQ